MILIAHNIRSLHNVGALFRSADAFGVEKLYLTGYTPAPPRKEIAKVALGSEMRVSWEKKEDVATLIDQLKKEGRKVLGLETVDDAVTISEARRRFDGSKIALVVGNEVDGIDSGALAACDAVVAIHMFGRKRSLNVSVAAGIALFALTSSDQV